LQLLAADAWQTLYRFDLQPQFQADYRNDSGWHGSVTALIDPLRTSKNGCSGHFAAPTERSVPLSRRVQGGNRQVFALPIARSAPSHPRWRRHRARMIRTVRLQTAAKPEVMMTKTEFPAILITGATGNVGRELVKQLSAQKVPYRALVRSSKAAEALSTLEGAEAVVGDFDKADTLVHALRGVERAFLLTNSSERAEDQQSNFVDLAQRHGVQHIVKLSQWAASPDSPVRFLRYHAAIERKIRESAMAYTFLRPNLFMQGLLAFKETIIGQGRFFAAIGNAKVSAIDVRDIASAAAAALVEQGHEGKTYDLTGPEGLSHREMAEKLSAALGRQIDFVDVPPGAMREALIEAGLPAWQADGLIEDYAHYSRGEAAEVTTGVRDAAGGLPRTFDDFASDYAKAFSAPHKPAA
jgi:uncharacterized protein YbjT (DUF2867 family)